MTIPILFGATAEAELIDAAHWYEDQQSGLGHRFISAVDATIHALKRWPRTGALVDDATNSREIRRAPVKGFPYHLGYLVTDDAMVVLAVAHDHRRPGFWHHREP